MEVFIGRPETNEGRIEKEIKVYDLLDSLNIEYTRVDHEPLMTIEACEEADRALGIHVCKNLFLCNRQKSAFYLLLIPGEKALQTKELSKQIQTSRLSFASGEDMEKYLNVTPGSATVMSLMFDTENQVQLVIDEEILEEEYLACHPCINTSCIKLRTENVINKFLKAVGHDFIKVQLTDGKAK